MNDDHPGGRSGSAAGAVPEPAPSRPGGPDAGDRAQRWFQALVEQSNDIVLVLDASGVIRYASPSASRQLGYELPDWEGRTAFDAIHRDDVVEVVQAFEDLVTRVGQQVPLSFRIVRADGTLLDAEAVATNRLTDDAVRGVVINLRDITERLRAERQARAVDERYRSLVSSLAEGVLLADSDAVAVLCNEALEAMFDVPARWLVGRSVPDVVAAASRLGIGVVDEHGQPAPVEEHPLMVALRRATPVTGSVQGIVRPGREVLWLEINARPVFDGDGAVTGVVASFTDVSAERAAAFRLQRALADLSRERTFLQVLLDNLEEGIVACDSEGRITLVNPASRRFFGMPDDVNPVGRRLSSAGMRHLDGSAMAPEESPLARALAGDAVREAQLVVESRDGVRRTVVANAQALRDVDGRELGAVVALHDVTEHKRTEERLAELALHDPLTGVANRLLLDDRLRRALERLRRGGGGVGVFLLDLDEFKVVNDVHGHDVGDEILRAVARRLMAATRPEDTVARLGGDEFVVVCEVSGGLDEVRLIAERVERTLSEPYQLLHASLAIGASVGGVLVDEPGAEPSKLISQADDEMYRVKAARRRARGGP